MVRCTFAKDPVSEEQDDSLESTNMHPIWSTLLTIASLTTLVLSNLRRVKLVWEYKTPQPEVHRLMPNTYRNI
jgi:hypothetical protein